MIVGRTLRLVRSTIQAVLGGLVGAVFGVALTLAVVSLLGRFGHFIFALHDLATVRLETVPVLGGLLVGAWFGEQRPVKFWNATGLGLLGLALGAATGWLLGALLQISPEWSWTLGVVLAATFGWSLALARAWPKGGSAEAAERAKEPKVAHGADAAWVVLIALAVIGAGGFAIDRGARVTDPELSEASPTAHIDLPPFEAVESVVLLVGDAGKTIEGRSPLLEALRHDVENWSAALPEERVAVLYLGDLVYPLGVRDRSHPDYARDSTRLWNQIGVFEGPAARERSARGFFLAGNHDWGNTSGNAGLQRIANLDAELEAARSAGIPVELQPPYGEAGPAVVDLGEHLRLGLLDTHWFLQNRSSRATDEFTAGVRETLEGAGERHVLFAAHHPYESVGPHGTTLPEYPAFGIGFVLRKTGAIVQDLNSAAYDGLLARMKTVFDGAERPPLVFAGGHDHSLQVLEGASDTDPTHVLVSGSGSKLSPIGGSTDLRFGASRPGYMTMITLRDGSVLLYVIAGNPDRLLCPEEEPARVECMVMGENDFDVVYSVQLAGPNESPADESLPDWGDDMPYWTVRSTDSVPALSAILAREDDDEVRRAPPVAVPMRKLAFGPDSVTATPGKEYDTDIFGRLATGAMHRELWRVPVRLPVLGLDTLGGGARVTELTGGMQTLGARFETESGVTFQFRSIVKDASATVPELLRGTAIADGVNDQMAAQFPLAAMVVAELLEAAGTLVARPVPVVMPNSPRLGDYRPLLAGRVGWLEVWPNEREEDGPGFAGSRLIVDGESILEELAEEPDARVDARAYLRVRLLDILVGDWDRHSDQWRWAAFEEGDRLRWEPISRDRDWAFNRTGALPEILSGIFLPRYVSFEAEYPPIDRLVRTGAEYDMAFLGGLSQADFEAEAASIVAALPDRVIEDAVGVLPRGYLEAAGGELVVALQARRDGLVRIARDFHENLMDRIAATRAMEVAG